MPVKISGDGTITGLVANGIDGTKVITTSAQPSGSVIQVVTAVTSTQVTITTEAYADTGLTCNITPTAANNKVLVMVDQHAYFKRSSDAGMGIKILRDSTAIHTPATHNDSGQDWLVDINTDPSHYGEYGRRNITVLDTIPGSWSSGAITYKTQACVWNEGSNAEVRCQYDLSTTDGTSRMILMEIAA